MKRTAYGIFEIAETAFVQAAAVVRGGSSTSCSRTEMLSAVELTCTICGLHWVAREIEQRQGQGFRFVGSHQYLTEFFCSCGAADTIETESIR